MPISQEMMQLLRSLDEGPTEEEIIGVDDEIEADVLFFDRGNSADTEEGDYLPADEPEDDPETETEVDEADEEDILFEADDEEIHTESPPRRTGSKVGSAAMLLFGYDSDSSTELKWWEFSNCLGVDPDLFFPERGASTREAKAVCEGCVVREDCLEYALDNGEKFGIWGGMSERERRRLRRQRALARRANEASGVETTAVD